MKPTCTFRWLDYQMGWNHIHPSARLIEETNHARVLQQWWHQDGEPPPSPNGEWRDIPIANEEIKTESIRRTQDSMRAMSNEEIASMQRAALSSAYQRIPPQNTVLHAGESAYNFSPTGDYPEPTKDAPQRDLSLWSRIKRWARR